MKRIDDQRRRLLCGLFAASAWAAARRVVAEVPAPSAADTAAARSAHFPFGAVVPTRPIPAWNVVTHTGAAKTLPAVLKGRTSALQLMFTSCSATCPIQGALFQQAQNALPKDGDFQLLSISIDPTTDTPKALTAWLQEYSAGPLWTALRPQAADIDPIFEVLARGGEARPVGTPDPHTGQVYIVNRRGELVYRTPSLPPAAKIVEALKNYAAA